MLERQAVVPHQRVLLERRRRGCPSRRKLLPLATALSICEAFGWESGVGNRFRDAPVFFGLYTFILFAGAAVVLIPGLDPIALIVGSQYLQGLLLPIVLVFMVRLVNDRALLGRHTNGRLRNTLAIACVGVVVVLDLVLLGSAAASAVS